MIDPSFAEGMRILKKKIVEFCWNHIELQVQM
jgi:hypothetical protein